MHRFDGVSRCSGLCQGAVSLSGDSGGNCGRVEQNGDLLVWKYYPDETWRTGLLREVARAGDCAGNSDGAAKRALLARFVPPWN